MLCTETVSPELLDLIHALCQEPILNDFNLVGGTALSLQLGHRISTDIDLFSIHAFDAPAYAIELGQRYSITNLNVFTNGIMGFFNMIKTDILSHQYPLVRPVLNIDGVRMVAMAEVGAMKLNAILGSGNRLKDFIDMYFILEHHSLNELIDTFVTKYPHVNHAIINRSTFPQPRPCMARAGIIRAFIALRKIAQIFSLNQPYILFLTRFTSKIRDGLFIITIHSVHKSKPNTYIISFQKHQKGCLLT